MWRKGMKAVCIENVKWTPHGIGPAKGDILAVTGVRLGREPENIAGEYLEFAEYLPMEGFLSTYFRPLVTKEQDVAMFRKIASSPPAKGREVEREYSNPRVGV